MHEPETVGYPGWESSPRSYSTAHSGFGYEVVTGTLRRRLLADPRVAGPLSLFKPGASVGVLPIAVSVIVYRYD